MRAPLRRSPAGTPAAALAAGAAMVAALLLWPAPVAAGGHVAVRTFEVTEAVPGGQVTVRIEARGFGRFGRLTETLPDGWTYTGSDLPEAAVSVDGAAVRFIVVGEGEFSYTVTAPSAEGSHVFSGRMENERREAVTVGGENEIAVRSGPPEPALVAVDVWQWRGEGCRVHVGAQRAGTSQPAPSSVALALEAGPDPSGRLRYGDLTLGPWPRDRVAGTLELRIFQAVTEECSVFVGARSPGESWLRVGMIPLPLEDWLGAAGGWRHGSIELRVPLPDGHAPGVCSNGIAVPHPERYPELVRDCAVLLQERDTLSGAADALNWSAERPVADWRGITVGGQPPRVTGISIRSGLRGRIPPGLARLDGLQELSLPDNGLTGRIPRELGLLPRLWFVDLRGNRLDGGIPPEIGERQGPLYVGVDGPSGEVPPELDEAVRSRGCLPDALREASGERERFGLPVCRYAAGPPEGDPGEIVGSAGAQPPFPRISCAVAVTAGDCATLLEAAEALVAGADLNWSADLALHHWTGVTTDPWTGRVIGVKLRGSGLEGQVPAAFGRLANLRNLDLGDNRLTGEIPTELAALDRLSRLDLNGNRLEGCIPGGLDRFGFDIGEFSNPALRYCPDDR